VAARAATLTQLQGVAGLP